MLSPRNDEVSIASRSVNMDTYFEYVLGSRIKVANTEEH